MYSWLSLVSYAHWQPCTALWYFTLQSAVWLTKVLEGCHGVQSFLGLSLSDMVAMVFSIAKPTTWVSGAAIWTNLLCDKSYKKAEHIHIILNSNKIKRYVLVYESNPCYGLGQKCPWKSCIGDCGTPGRFPKLWDLRPSARSWATESVFLRGDWDLRLLAFSVCLSVYLSLLPSWQEGVVFVCPCSALVNRHAPAQSNGDKWPRI